jgi:tetratricopeptide (TPR) repeat protein
MTAIRPNLLKLLAPPLAAFALGVALLTALAGPGEVAPPERASQSYASLGYDQLQEARDGGDPTYYTRAERSFDAALRQDARDVDALLGSATLAGLRHDFAEQLRLGREAHRLMPETVAAYPEIADAQVELGRYRAAELTLQRLLDVKPNLTSYSRVSYLRELHGDLPGAVEAMRRAVSAGAGAPENVAYVQVLLGDLELQRGRTRAARLAYTSALRSLPGFPAGLVGLARVDAAGGDPGRAAARLRRAAERLPLVSTLVLLAELERELGNTARARAALDGARAQQQLFRAAATEPDAKAVLFEADFGNPAAAVALGRRVWERAPSVRSADALGWALTRSGRAAAGHRWARRALRLGSRDALFRFHAGIAARAAGRPYARDLRMAIKGGAALSPRQLRQARAALR